MTPIAGATGVSFKSCLSQGLGEPGLVGKFTLCQNSKLGLLQLVPGGCRWLVSRLLQCRHDLRLADAVVRYGAGD